MKNKGISLMYSLIIFSTLSLLSLAYLEYIYYRSNILKLDNYRQDEYILYNRLLKKEFREIKEFNKKLKLNNCSYFNCIIVDNKLENNINTNIKSISNYKILEIIEKNDILYIKYVKEILNLNIYALEKVKVIIRKDKKEYISLSYEFLEKNYK